MGINRRLKLYSGLNVVGWLVVMPVLMVVLLSPVVNFHAWPGAVGLDRETSQVALLPPRLTEHGSSLARLSERPQPSARVPVHATVATTFRPATATRDSSPRRVHAAPERRVSAPARRGPVRRPQTARGTTRSAPRRPQAPAAQPAAPAARPAPPVKAPPPRKPEDPQHGQADKPGPPPHAQPQPPAKHEDPQHGQAGKGDDPQRGRGAGNGDDPRQGEQGKGRGRE